MARGFLRAKVLGAALIAALCAAPVNAANVKGWDVSTLESGDACSMSATFQDDVTMFVFWYPRDQRFLVSFGSPNWDSLRERDKQTVRMDMRFGGNIEYDHWWNEESYILALSDGFEAVSASFGKENSGDLAVAFAYGTNVTVEIDGKTIGTYKLNDSKDAIIALRRCGAKILQKGGDPFAS